MTTSHNPLGAAAPALSAEDLGFTTLAPGACWHRGAGGRTLDFRVLRSMADLAEVETLQRETFGVSDLDLVPASELIVVEETGGAVIGAFEAGTMLGVVVGWGGYVGGVPRVVSDFLGVRRASRSLGLGTELKRLQAVVALERGFREIVWTVDPLRAANARLNFEKLGAYADRYEVNRYGESFGPGLYGGLPTDRIHLTWPIAQPGVRARLLGRVAPRDRAALSGVPIYRPGLSSPRATLEIPSDIDALLAQDRAAARDWRLRLRDLLQDAFARGYRITGFVPGGDAERGLSAYLIERTAPDGDAARF